jgi:hypothetical protein
VGCSAKTPVTRQIDAVPRQLDPFVTAVMTLNDVYAYPTKHFDFHALQLNLPRPGER